MINQITPLFDHFPYTERFNKRHAEVQKFIKALPKVQRLLANISTYMINDDHEEVTDDWYLTDEWRHQVLRSALGRYIVGNALVSFGLFQAWGNDPKAFTQGKK